MKKIDILIILMLVFSVFLTGCKSAQPTTYNLTITVKDADGKAVEGAEVTLGEGDYSTDSKGVVSVKGLTEAEVYVFILKDGYESIDETVVLKKGDNKKSYTLKKLEVIEPSKNEDTLLGFDTLNSYSYYMEIGLSKTDIETVIEGFREKPDMFRLIMTTNKGKDTTEIITVGDQGKMKVSGLQDWIDIPGDYEDPFGGLLIGQGEFARSSFADKLAYNVDKIGSETISGLPVIKYHITAKNKEDKTDLYLWIVTSGDLKNLVAKSENNSPVSGNTSYIMIELKSVNKPLNIKLP